MLRLPLALELLLPPRQGSLAAALVGVAAAILDLLVVRVVVAPAALAAPVASAAPAIPAAFSVAVAAAAAPVSVAAPAAILLLSYILLLVVVQFCQHHHYSYR